MTNQDGHDDITTGVTTWSPRDTCDTHAKNQPTWPATEVWLRAVESGLGGHEEGVIGVDAGVENASLSLRKRGRMSWSKCATFSGFTGVEKDSVGE